MWMQNRMQGKAKHMMKNASLSKATTNEYLDKVKNGNVQSKADMFK